MPRSVEPVGDLLAAIAASNVELRITRRLMQLWQRVIGSTLAYSGTRLRNARGYEGQPQIHTDEHRRAGGVPLNAPLEPFADELVDGELEVSNGL